MEEFEQDSEILLVPRERVGAIIGKNGAAKRKIEAKTGTKLEIDSGEGEIEIIPKKGSLGKFKAQRIVKAIARGFSPEKAMRLLKDDVFLEMLDLRDIIGKNKSALKAKKGRVIGSKGKARAEIEAETGALISVYGRTIAIIGNEKEIGEAKKAVKMLLGGASHATVSGSLKRHFESNYFEL